MDPLGRRKKFYINVGIAFDAICKLAGLPVLDRPKEYECDNRGTRGRLEQLISGAPSDWVLTVGVDVTDVVAELDGFIRKLVEELDRIDGLSAYRSHYWFDRFRPKRENAQVLFLLGDMAGAWNEVRTLASLFADRQNANDATWWLEQLRLPLLSLTREKT